MKGRSHSRKPAPQAAPKPTTSPLTSPMTLEIEKVVAGGQGLSRSEKGVVLVAGALPGERVQAQVHETQGVFRGKIVQLERAHPERKTPVEPLPTADLAHASYPLQLEIKRGLVQDALRRIGRLEAEIDQTVSSPHEWGYRNGAQYLITPQGLAYRQRRGHQPWLLPRDHQGLPHDPMVMQAVGQVIARLDTALLSPAREIALRGSRHSNEVVATLIGEGHTRQYLRAADALLDAGVVGVTLAQPAGRRFSAGVQLITGEREITEQLGDVLVSISASGFAQVNPEAAGLAYRLATKLAGSGKVAVDLYGGSGAIARHLAPHFEQVVVIDSAGEALRRGQHDVQHSVPAGQQPASNVRFVHGDATLLPDCDVLVVDPPRAGLDAQAREAVARSSAYRLVYVSCDPATWARDVGVLTREGWSLKQVTPYDFYPQTSHVEVVSLLERE